MRNENLIAVCRDLGFDNVSTVISSGNVIFDSRRTDPRALETSLEKAWSEQLGFNSVTIVRTREDLVETVSRRPFGDVEHGSSTYLLATFTQRPLEIPFNLPYRPPKQLFQVVAAFEREVFTVTDTSGPGTPNVMPWLEREFGRSITSRTWLTVHRVLRRMGVDDW